MDIINLDEAIKRMEGDRQMLVATAEIVLQDAPDLMAELGKASAAGNAETAFRCAHSLKGLALTFGAERAATAAANIESACKRGIPSDLHVLVQTFADELAELTSRLEQLIASEGQAS